MYMKNVFHSLVIATALCLVCGCSSDSDDNPPDNNSVPVSEAPQWKVEFNLPKGQEGKPDWQQVDFYQFENTMTIVLHLEDEMAPFLSKEDQMAGIVNGEVREIADIQLYSTSENRQGNLFMLLIPYADSDRFVDVYYYNAKTNQTFPITTTDLRGNNTVGSEVDFVVGLFTLGNITAKLADNMPFTPSAGDMLALFVDEVCCGVGNYDAKTQTWTVKAYDLSLGSTEAHFRYYSAERRAIYKTAVMIDFKTIRRAVETPYYLSF